MPSGGSSVYNVLAVTATGLGSFTYGFNSAVIGSVFGLPSFFEYFGLSSSGLEQSSGASATVIGAANGLFAGGGLIGCMINPWLSDKIGRVRAIQIICVLAIVSAAIQAASVKVAMFLVGRALNGIAAGMISATVPVYQSEVSPAKNRGRLVSTHGIFLVSGYSGSAWSGVGCYFAANPQVQWRLCLALQAVAPLLLLAASFWVPESPRWLVMNGKGDRALKILERLHTAEGEVNDFARGELMQIQQQLDMQNRNENLITLLKQPANRKRFFAGVFVQVLTQSTGILVVNNYQTMLWKSLGLKAYLPLLLYAVYLSWAIVLNVISSMIVDRAGRVRMLTIGIMGAVIMLSCFTALFATYGGTTNKAGVACCILFLFLWLTFYASCIDAVSFVYCSEIFPTQMRSQGVAASVGGLFAMTLLLTEVAATAFAQVGWRFYLVFIIVPASGLPILWRFPETKGLSLEEIAVRFGDENPGGGSGWIDDAGKHGQGSGMGSIEAIETADAKHEEGHRNTS